MAAMRVSVTRIQVMFFAAVLAVVMCVPGARAQAADDDTDFDVAHLEQIGNRDEVDDGIDKGIAWLVSRQDPQTGAFEGKLKTTYTGLSCIALMAAGHFPGRSEYGDNLRCGILYLCAEAESRDGPLQAGGNERMYGHGICTLALTEAYGMLGNEKDNLRVKRAAEKALALTVRAQVRQGNAHDGGWRYAPNAKDSDLSVAVWHVLALRSAENCQLDVPGESISRAVDYVRRTYTNNGKESGFSYQPGQVKPAMRCAGAVCMLALGAAESGKDLQKVLQSASFLSDYSPDKIGSHFFYTSYYVSTAANMVSEDMRTLVLPRMERHLLGLQSKDGSFRNHKGYDGGVYSTAFSIICLAVRYQYLPIYQE